MRYLLDTNVISEPKKPAPSSKVSNWLMQHRFACAISSVTFGDLVKGVALMSPAHPQKESYQKWLENVEREYDESILPFTLEISKVWGTLYAKHQLLGCNLPRWDSQIAATALFHGLTVVTRNTADFPPEVRVLNPWL